MTQAILITAYKNFSHIEEVIKCFDSKFAIYIHIDSKTPLSPEKLERLKQHKIVKLVSQRYKVNWGGFNHLKSILYLSEKALQDPSNYYFHLISGHDFPIKNKKEFETFFKENQNSEFLDWFSLPKPDWADNGGMDRILYYNLHNLLDAKDLRKNRLIKRIVELQKKLKIKRTFPTGMPKLFGGSTWWSLSRECLNYVVQYSRNNQNILKRFKNTFCSEEFFFPTVIMNSQYADRVQNTNNRFIDWRYRNGNNPAVLDASDFDMLMNSNKFFARKFEPAISTHIIRKLQKEVHDRS